MKKSNKFLFVILISLLSLVSVKAQYIGFSPSDGQNYNLSSGASTATVTITWTWELTSNPYVYSAYAKLTIDGSTVYRTGIKNNNLNEIPQSISADPGTHTLTMELYEDFGGGYGVSFTSNHTIYVKNGIIAQNNFSGGVISLEGNQVSVNGTDNKVYKLPNESVSVGSVEQSNDNYWMVWNTSGTYNSNWKRNDVNINGETASSLSYTVATNDNSAILKADMKKLCSLEFNNSYSSMYVNGSTYSSTATVGVVEQNSITAYGNTYTSNGIEYRFSNWSYYGGTSSSTVTATEHRIYSANYDSGRPVYVSFSFGSTVGDPVRVIWTDNPNSAVTQYKIYRRAYINGSYTAVSLVGTVSNGVGYFDDPDYLLTNWQQGTWLEYSVEAYYSTAGTWSDGGWDRIYGQLYKKNEKTELVGIPVDYSIKNYPNPFNPTTTINYQLPKDGIVSIKVYDIIGKEVTTLVNEHRSAGYYKVDFDASKLTSGVYIATIQTSGFNKSIKLLLTK